MSITRFAHLLSKLYSEQDIIKSFLLKIIIYVLIHSNLRSINEQLPRYSSPNFTQEEIGSPILEVTLEPGDLLYLPRGFIHQASTVPNQHSLHVTISVYQKTAWIDLLEKVSTKDNRIKNYNNTYSLLC